MTSEATEIVRVSDIIRISVALIQQIHDLPEHRTLRVRLDHIQVEPDGSKVLHLTRVDWDD
jgi:hypothetical protein